MSSRSHEKNVMKSFKCYRKVILGSAGLSPERTKLKIHLSRVTRVGQKFNTFFHRIISFWKHFWQKKNCKIIFLVLCTLQDFFFSGLHSRIIYANSQDLMCVKDLIHLVKGKINKTTLHFSFLEVSWIAFHSGVAPHLPLAWAVAPYLTSFKCPLGNVMSSIILALTFQLSHL